MEQFFTSLSKRQTMLLLTSLAFGGSEAVGAYEHLDQNEEELLKHRALAIDRHVHLLQEVVGSDIIESGCVVFVGVCEDDSIDVPDRLSQHLLAKVGSCIDNKALVLYFNVDGSPEPLVAEVKRFAHFA